MAQLDRILDKYDLPTLEAAIARRRTREKKNLRALEKKRKKIEAELRKLQARTNGSKTRNPMERKPNARRMNEITLAEALRRVMAGRSKPMHYKDLTDTVLKRKLYRTNSKNLMSTVMVTLTRDDRFKRVRPGMFALK